MKKREQGILTVEASIVLTLLTLFVLFLLSFGRVYRAQNLVSHATIQTADSVALESYLRETALQSDVGDIVYLASSITDSTVINAEGLESLRSADLPKIAKQKFITAIASSETEADEKLKSMGVKNGLAGVDFTECKVDLGNDDVIVAITYTIEMQFPVFGADELTVTKTAKAKTFGEILFEVSTEPSNPGWGSTSGDDKVVHGSTVEITATPNYGYEFVSWDDGVTDNPRTVTVTDAMHYVAIFEKKENGVNLSIDNGEYGVYETDRGKVSGAGNYKYLDTVTITAEPKQHYYFAGWDDNGDGIPDGNSDLSRTITIDKVEEAYFFSAIFKPVVYTITVKSNNSAYGYVQVQQGGTKGSSIQAEYGSTVQLLATSYDNVRYKFDKWSNNSTQASTSVTVTGDAVYEARFILNTYTVNFYNDNTKVHTTTVIRGSSIDGSRTHTSASMAGNPTKSGAIFDFWKYNGSTFNSSTVVNGNINVYASWKYTVTLNANGGNISGSSIKTFTVAEGSTFNFSSYTPGRNGFTFNGWYSGSTKHTSTIITSNVSVSASWNCRHQYDDGTTMYYPISSEGGGCSNSQTIYQCGGCTNTYSINGVGRCVYEAWCGTIHNYKNPGWYPCTNKPNHRWTQYGCITCIHCGQCKNGGYDRYGTYRSGGDGTKGCMWCVLHNGHTNRPIKKRHPHP